MEAGEKVLDAEMKEREKERESTLLRFWESSKKRERSIDMRVKGERVITLLKVSVILLSYLDA